MLATNASLIKAKSIFPAISAARIDDSSGRILISMPSTKGPLPHHFLLAFSIVFSSGLHEFNTKGPVPIASLDGLPFDIISDEIIDGKNSLVWDEAENRMHSQKALLEFLI